MDLYCSNCPTHGVRPVGFFQQLPQTFARNPLTVTITVKCPECDHSYVKTYPLTENDPMSKPTTPVHTIHPYVSKWGNERVWVFDDPSKGLLNEGLVSGTDVILDQLSATFDKGDEGFALSFSSEPFEGSQFRFDWVRSGTGEGLGEGVTGNWYTQKESGFNGWLCPNLMKYFDSPPAHIYVKAAPIEGKLERGTGKVIVGGKVVKGE